MGERIKQLLLSVTVYSFFICFLFVPYEIIVERIRMGAKLQSNDFRVESSQPSLSQKSSFQHGSHSLYHLWFLLFLLLPEIR